LVLEARYFQANATIMMRTGITTRSMSPVAVSSNVFSWMPISPLGERISMLQPPSSMTAPTPNMRVRVARRGCFTYSLGWKVGNAAKQQTGMLLGSNVHPIGLIWVKPATKGRIAWEKSGPMAADSGFS